MHRSRRTPLLLAAWLALAAAGCSPAADPSSSAPGGEADAAAGGDRSQVVARVGGEDVTLAELDRWIKEELFREEVSGQDPATAYELRREKLEEMIARNLVEAEARRRNVTPEQLMTQQAQEVAVSDEEVQAFFDANQQRLGGASFEQIAPRIRQHLEASKARDARTDLVRSLQEDAGVEILMEAPRVQVAATGPSLGPAEAPVTIVEFSDFQCPFCARAAPVVKQIRERYPDEVRIVYRHFPLDSIHPRARAAAVASLCAAEQGRFWEYHDVLFQNTRALSDEDLARYAEQVELDAEAFGQCVAEDRYAAQVAADLEAGRAAGVTGTPSFFVNGRKLGGAKPLDDFVDLIEEELGRGGATAPAAG